MGFLSLGQGRLVSGTTRPSPLTLQHPTSSMRAGPRWGAGDTGLTCTQPPPGKLQAEMCPPMTWHKDLGGHP